MGSLATRLTALERKAQGKGYAVGPKRPEPPLPEGMVNIGGLLYYEMSETEWAEVEAILVEAHRLAGHTGLIEYPEPAGVAPLVLGGLRLNIPAAASGERPTAATVDGPQDDYEDELRAASDRQHELELDRQLEESGHLPATSRAGQFYWERGGRHGRNRR